MKAKNEIQFEVYAKNALFSDPLTRQSGEKCSLQIPTYEALNGILMAIYWKPTIIWIVDAVRIMNPIQTESVGMATQAINKPMGFRDLTYYTYLKDVRYQVKAHFEWNENRPDFIKDRDLNKHSAIMNRSLDLGGRHDIYLGVRECQGYVEPCDFGSGIGAYDNIPELGFGFMYHGLTYPDTAFSPETKGMLSSRFWHPVMKNGIIEFIRPDQCKTIRPIRKMPFRKFDVNKGGVAQ